MSAPRFSLGDAMAGSVYVFNGFNEPCTVTVRDHEVAAIGPWTTEASTPYVPLAAPVARTRDPQPDSGTFANGKNEVSIMWASGTGRTRVVIPCPNQGVSLEDTLILLLLQPVALLMNERGYTLGQFDLEWPACLLDH